MKRFLTLLVVLCLLLCGCLPSEPSGDLHEISVSVPRVEGIADDFIMGADVSSILSLETSGRKFYDFDGEERDIFRTLSANGVNYVRVRVWNDPFDKAGNGYGGGNCTLDTAIEIGRRATECHMELFVDFHYSDFWADPGKQAAPKAWENLSLDEKASEIYAYTVRSIRRIQENGVRIGMVQVGNETTGGFCGETEKDAMYRLMRAAAQAVRDTDENILIAVHYTNPEKKMYAEHAADLKKYGVDYDVFGTSYYPEYHGSLENLREQLDSVITISEKKVMIAETSWAYQSSVVGPYKRSVQGQVDEIADCIRLMAGFGDKGLGVFYWEPAWIDVPGDNLQEIIAKREQHGAGWSSSYAGEYDPVDAGQNYGGTACIPSALFDPEGHPLDSLKTFVYIRQGYQRTQKNEITDPSFEDTDHSMWKIMESIPGTVNYQNKPADARSGDVSLHFWNESAVEFTAEQTVKGLPEGKYTFCLSVQGDGEAAGDLLRIYAISDGIHYEQEFSLDGWAYWRVPAIENIVCSDGEITVGIEIRSAAGTWGSVDQVELYRITTEGIQ